MSVYKLELTEIEVACGVTLEQVQEVLPMVYVTTDGLAIFPGGYSPALCGAVARCVFAGAKGEFKWFNSFGQPVYAQVRMPN